MTQTPQGSSERETVPRVADSEGTLSSEAISPGSVFISYAREDRARVEPLVKYLANIGFDVWWDRDIEVGTSFRSAIQNALDEAACIVVVWTMTSVDKDFVRSEAAIGQAQGILFPILLDANARIPIGLTEIQYRDLTHWDGTEETELRRVAEGIRSWVARGPSQVRYQATLSSSDWILNNSQRAVSELRDLTSRFRSISDLLVSDAAPAKDLRGALKEVGKTYGVVNSAILQFITPAITTGAIDPKPFVDMERGTLKAKIENGRGHCGRILTYYGRYGGLRDWIKHKLSSEELGKVDDVFARLGTADGDLFRPLAEIGNVLTTEARVIVNLLIAGQEDAARQRIRDGRMKLNPLEEQLSIAMQELQQLEGSLGYAEPLVVNEGLTERSPALTLILTPINMTKSQKVQLGLAFAFGFVFVAVIVVIAIFIPNPSLFQYQVFRIVLALAAGGVAAVIPGILNVNIPNFLTAGGALAVFVVVYFYSPAQLVTIPLSSP